MKKDEYMGALKGALAGFDEELVQEIVTDYEERFRVGTERGKTEEQVIRELGSIRDLVEELGEFRQNSGAGFHTTAGTVETVKTITVSENVDKEEVQEQAVTENEQTQKCSGEDSTDYQKAEENRNTYGKSGTYYQEKSFSESFDSAMRKFGRALEGVMKEAGRVIEEAATQFEIHMEEAKKNKYYTGNGDNASRGSEKEGDAEPNVKQEGFGLAGCRRVVVDADFADVSIRTTKEEVPKAVCHYYSHKTAIMYPFYAYQEGDTFYVGVRQGQETERKSGFFQFSMSPSIEIDLMLPENIVLVDGGSSSGDFELKEVVADEVALHTKSGDVKVNFVNAGSISMESMSGDLALMKSSAKKMELTTKSGDCSVDRLTADLLLVSTASGDVAARSLQVVNVTMNTMSGDISVDALEGNIAKFHTASGDLNISDVRGEVLEAGSASGGVDVEADCKQYILKSTSGNVALESRHDADVMANSTSGDVEVHIVEALETYQVTMHSVSGECSTSGQTRSADTVPTRNIEAKTISGDICIAFF